MAFASSRVSIRVAGIGLALAVILATGGRAVAQTSVANGDWFSGSTWSTGTPPSSGSDPSINNYSVTVSGMPATVATVNVNDNGRLIVLDGGSVTANGGFSTFVTSSNAFFIDELSRIDMPGYLFFRGGVNSIDFAATPTQGKLSVSADGSVLVVGDQGPATLNIGPGSMSPVFNSLSSWDGANAGIINISGATVGFRDGASLGGKLNLTSGAVVNLGGEYSLFVGNSDAISLDASSRVNITDKMYFRGGVNTLDFTNTPTNGKVSISPNALLVVGDQVPATLTIGPGSTGAQFGSLALHDGASQATLNINAAVTFNGDFDLGGQATVNQAAGQRDGLTLLAGFTVNDRSAEEPSVLSLAFDAGTVSGSIANSDFSDPATFSWALRWQGNRTTALTNLFLGNKLTVDTGTGGGTFSPGNNIYFDSASNYTYVGFVAVPEPGMTGAMAIGGLAAVALWRRGRRLQG